MTKTKTKAAKGKAFRIPPQPLDDQMIKYFVDYYKQHKAFPGSKIPCTISGKLSTCMGPWMKKKIKQFGGPEQLLRSYVCRGAIKNQKVKVIKEKKVSKKTKIVLKDTHPDKPKRYDIPRINFEPPRPATDAELADITRTTCLRPDIFLNNGRHCDSCESYSLCLNAKRTLPKDVQFDGKNFVYVEKPKKSKKK